jgi:hypothetical protein
VPAWTTGVLRALVRETLSTHHPLQKEAAAALLDLPRGFGTEAQREVRFEMRVLLDMTYLLNSIIYTYTYTYIDILNTCLYTSHPIQIIYSCMHAHAHIHTMTHIHTNIHTNVHHRLNHMYTYIHTYIHVIHIHKHVFN